ncbi:MAG TPA: alkaline phosphatase family protein, partial [Verrucomicrobiae bacterium]
GPDGSFAVTSKKYTGTVPGGSSGGSKGYGLSALRLEKAGVYSGRTNLPPRQPGLELPVINGIKTVFMILMENHDWDTIVGSPFCPYINTNLLPKSSYTTRYYSPLGVHPSEPNYLWLVSGTNFNVRNDDAPSLNHQSSTNTLFHLLDRAGLSWKCYAEDISGTTVPDVNSGQYAVRHVPFVYFDSVRSNLSYSTNHIRPFGELARDLTNNTVARFNFLVPNTTNDMHDLSPGSPSTRVQGDNWLAREMPKILASPAYTNGGAIFIVWDEGSNETDGPMGMIVLSPRAKGGGYHNDIFYTHSSLLRSLQDIFGVKPYLADAAYANNLSDLFKTIRVTSARWVTNSLRLGFTNVIAGKTNYIQAAFDLAATNWVNIKSNVAASTSFIFTNPPASFGRRFYRLVELP